jgi:protein SCO1
VNRVVLAGVVVVAGAAAVGAAAGLASRSDSATPGTTSPTNSIQTVAGLKGDAVFAPGQRPAPAFTLRDQTGRTVTLHSLDNRPLLITFLDSRCKNQCPIEGRQLTQAVDRMHGAEPPAIVVVGVNPLQDTPASEQKFAKEQGWSKLPWYWLSGTRAALAPVWKKYGIQVITKRYIVPGTKPVINVTHTIAVYLVDRHGDERAAFLPPLVPAQVAEDVRRLEGSGA